MKYVIVDMATGAEYSGTGCEDCDVAVVAFSNPNAICTACADDQDLIDMAAIEFLD